MAVFTLALYQALSQHWLDIRADMNTILR